MEKNRLEAFSDGVLAIIITIMVLELKRPTGPQWNDLLVLTPVLLGYGLSFLYTAIYWVNHHLLFHKAKRINVKILWCNIAWLFVMSFIPFTTEWIGSYPTAAVPVSVYFADMFLACATYHYMYYLVARENGNRCPFRLSPKNIASIVVYMLAALFGALCPYVAYAVVALVTIWWIIPEKKKVK